MKAESADPIGSADVQAISDWLIEQGLSRSDIEALVAGLCERLGAAGLPLWRGHVSVATLHPSIAAIAYDWLRGSGIVATPHAPADDESEDWKDSAPHHMITHGLTSLRRRLEFPDEAHDFPFLATLRSWGATDYYAQLAAFDLAEIRDRPTGVIASWTSDAPGGFSDAHIAVLDRLLPRLALSLKVALGDEIAVTLLDTYVGPATGRRILGGNITRGEMEVVPAVIFYADLRGFTAVTDALPRDALGDMLNAYFECMVRPVVARGGQILKYLGDGLLATFELRSDVADTLCGHALAAAEESLASVRRLNHERSAANQPIMELDIALHLGDVLYGNVGAADRLDFTVIGPAVNEASRIEILCGALGRNLLISEAFVAAATGCAARLVSVGRHALRGVSRAQELFTLPL